MVKYEGDGRILSGKRDIGVVKKKESSWGIIIFVVVENYIV